MHPEVINQKTKRLLAALGRQSVLRKFYLAGGTGLALQFGHRQSIDLDFFSPTGFRPDLLKQKLVHIGRLTVEMEEKGTLNLSLAGVAISFLAYPYKLLFPLKKWEGISLADARDIACMKLDAVSARGSRKDFIDLYFFLQEYRWEELWQFFQKKYQGIEYNQMHILKSLTYFVEADKEPMPKMLQPVRWSTVKKFFVNLAKGLLI